MWAPLALIPTTCSDFGIGYVDINLFALSYMLYVSDILDKIVLFSYRIERLVDVIRCGVRLEHQLRCRLDLTTGWKCMPAHMPWISIS